MKLYRFPSVRELAAALVAEKRAADWDGYDSFDVRLQVLPGGWSLWAGDASFDTDHRGVWGLGR
jgi:hypothetical protein